MPAIEADLLLNGLDGEIIWDLDTLKLLVDKRLDDDRAVIVDGICLLEHLKTIGRQPDFLVYLVNESLGGSEGLRDRIVDYENRFKPSARADSPSSGANDRLL